LGKRTWIDRAIQTYNYHCSKLREGEGWIITDTARALKRSTGSVGEDLLIASWLKMYGNKIREFKYAYQALEFIRNKKRQMMTEIHLD